MLVGKRWEEWVLLNCAQVSMEGEDEGECGRGISRRVEVAI